MKFLLFVHSPHKFLEHKNLFLETPTVKNHTHVVQEREDDDELAEDDEQPNDDVLRYRFVLAVVSFYFL